MKKKKRKTKHTHTHTHTITCLGILGTLKKRYIQKHPQVMCVLIFFLLECFLEIFLSLDMKALIQYSTISNPQI